jgi:hypothetical protein
MTMTDSSLLLDDSNSQFSSSSLNCDLQTPQTTSWINVPDDNFSHLNYACDNFTPGAEEWLASNEQLLTSQHTQQYIPPPSMVFPTEDDIEGQDDLISFGGAFEFRKTRNSSDVPGQVHPFAHLEMSLVDESKPQIPGLEAGQTMRRFATPRRKNLSADNRQKTAQTRKLTACVRCRMQRIRVRTHTWISGQSPINVS